MLFGHCVASRLDYERSNCDEAEKKIPKKIEGSNLLATI